MHTALHAFVPIPLVFRENMPVRLKLTSLRYLVYHLEGPKTSCHFNTDGTLQGMSLSKQADILFHSTSSWSTLYEGDSTIESVHRERPFYRLWYPNALSESEREREEVRFQHSRH
ncbi:hypothetical protein TNCV_2130731 [Trichonephila clavipes]|nr:hypothetical protein TNCV_2130731 [Trichonephila clavipes]